MRIVCIADTHGYHKKLKLPDGDVLLCAGDVTPAGELPHALNFCQWLGKSHFAHKIVVAGNHDWCFDDSYRNIIIDEFRNAGIVYLEDSGCLINNVKIYGSPWQPEFRNWAFNLPRGEPLWRKWSLIPDDVQILITHGPPSICLGLCEDGFNAGCEDLSNRIKSLAQLKLHVFGHVHEAYGQELHDGVYYVNASNCTSDYELENKPIVVEL